MKAHISIIPTVNSSVVLLWFCVRHIIKNYKYKNIDFNNKNIDFNNKNIDFNNKNIDLKLHVIVNKLLNFHSFKESFFVQLIYQDIAFVKWM